MFITAARFPINDYKSDEAVRLKADSIQKHLQELALDNGFDPEENVTLAEFETEMRIGISEEMDDFIREAPGTWRNY